MTVNEILNQPHLLKFNFKKNKSVNQTIVDLNKYRIRYEKERRAIRLLFTLVLIEDILRS